MSIKKIMHKDRHGAQVSIEFGEGGAASNLVEQFLGGLGVPAMQDIPREHPGDPKGTDTVPAWLTPGEFVMNAEATRMFEPQIEEMNNAGRAVQRQQGGSIPEYKSYGGSIPEYHDDGGMAGSWVNESVLDAVLGVESNGNFNAVSPAGARGGYQIMPATAANPGYGVTALSPEEVLDPMKSREFARQYLVGLAKQYPDATQQEIFQMYNAGAGRVNNANAFNPLSQETIDYPGKIEAEMERMAKLAAANGSVDDDYDIPLDYNTVPVPEEVVTMESLRSPTSDEDVLTSLKGAQATAASTPEEEDAFDKILSSGKDVGQWIMDNKVDAALMGLTFVPGVGVVAMAARGLSLANKLNNARKGKVALDAITKSQRLINKPVVRLGPKSASLNSVPKLAQKTSPLRQANAGAATLGAAGMGLNSDSVSDFLGDRLDIVNARSTDKMLAYNAGEREKLIAGLESGDLRPDYVKKALADLDKQDAKFKKATANVSIMDFNKTKDDLEAKAKRLIDAGYVAEGNALLEQVPPPPTSDGVAPLTPSQAAAGMVAPVEDRSMTTAQTDAEVDSSQDQADRAAAAAAGVAQLQKDITAGTYTSGSVKKYNTTGNPDDLVDKGDQSMLSKVKDFFKEGLGTVLDKGALSEAATLYLGSRALGYDHEGSLNFVTKRYGKGIENKLAIANKAVGKYTNDSITKYKDTGNLMDLTLIPKLIDQNKPVTFVVPETGELLNLNTMKDENGLTVIVNEKNEPVNTRSLLKADEYRSRSSSNISKITPLLEDAKKKMKANNTDDDFDADGLFNTAAVAQAISNHALSNKFNDAEVSKLTPYVTTFIQKARSMGGDTYKDVNDMDLAEMAITQGIARREEPNLFETGIRGEVDPVLWQTEIDLEFPDIDKKFNAREKALMFKTIYQYGYSQRTPKEIEMYRSKAVAGSNGFLVYLKEASQEDGGKWKPKFNALLNNK